MSPATVASNLYAELEVPGNASTANIIAAYRRLSLIYHPDKAKTDQATATEKMARLNNARDVLTDIHIRREYDLSHPAVSTSPQRHPAKPTPPSSVPSKAPSNSSTREDCDTWYGVRRKSDAEQAYRNRPRDTKWHAELEMDRKRGDYKRAEQFRDQDQTEWQEMESEAESVRQACDLWRRERGEWEKNHYQWKEANQHLRLAKRDLVRAEDEADFAKRALGQSEEKVVKAKEAWKQAAAAVAAAAAAGV